jgi:hypothetical protein
MNNTPYLNSKKQINKYEKVKYEDIQNYNKLIEHNICYDIINYIIKIEHKNENNEAINTIGSTYNCIPRIIDFDENTKYRPFLQILKKII